MISKYIHDIYIYIYIYIYYTIHIYNALTCSNNHIKNHYLSCPSTHLVIKAETIKPFTLSLKRVSLMYIYIYIYIYTHV